MTDIYKGILQLIKSAITGKAAVISDNFNIDTAFAVIRKHHIVPLAYEGAALCGISKDGQTMQAMFREYCRSSFINDGQLRAVRDLCEAFDENGIDYLPIKGCNIKKLYPKPELRVMGDADILIRTEQYGKIIPVMEKLGYTAELESNHEYAWNTRLLYVELHKYLIPSYNKDYYAYFGDGWKRAVKETGCRYKMSVEDEYIYIFTHFAKHYRDGGIGCNHVTDLWVYKRNYPNMDMQYVEKELKKLRLLEFYKNIMRLVSVWFEESQEDEMTAFITDFIFKSGSWGISENHILSAEVKNAQAAGTTEDGKKKTLLDTVFPNAEALSQRYSILKKTPWLLPIMWAVRWGEAILFRREDIKKRRDVLKFATVDKIETYQQALEYVGLDFRFE